MQYIRHNMIPKIVIFPLAEYLSHPLARTKIERGQVRNVQADRPLSSTSHDDSPGEMRVKLKR